MKKCSLFFIALILTVTLLTGYASGFSSICHCLAGYTNHACCEGKQELSCHQHQAVKPAEEKHQKDCSCSVSSDSPANAPLVASPIDNQFLILWIAASGISQDLSFSHTIQPTWLRRIYYPDQSHVYLDIHRLLI